MIRMPIAINRPFSDYDTSNIQSARQANILLNLYSTLFEYDREGNLIPGVAESFEWVKNETELHFKIKENLYTIDQKLITAEDVYYTFLRLIYRDSNTHGSLKSFICPTEKLDNINDKCKGLSFDGNRVILKPIRFEVKKFILPLIANVDYGIIPKGSIDWQNKNLPIIDYRNTSGPYYLKHEASDGNSILSVNPYHYNYKPNIPTEVELFVSSSVDSIKYLREGVIDLIPTYNGSPLGERILLMNESNLFNVHQTEKIDLKSLRFTKKGIKKFSSQERLCIGSFIKKAFLEMFGKVEAVTSTNEFFPIFGEGSLDEEQKKIIINHLKQFEGCDFNKKVEISEVEYDLKAYQERFKNKTNFQFTPLKVFPWQKPESEQEDAFLSFSDTGFYESISLLSHYLPTITDFTNEETQLWIENYMAIEEKELRLEKLRNFHFEILKQGFVIPIGVAPYVAVAKKPWNPNFYKFFAGTPIWMLEKEQ